MRQNWLYGVVLVFNACDSMPEPSVAPPGTIQTAQRLTLGFGAGYISSSTVGVGLCLNNDGICVTTVKLTRQDCHDYSGAEFTLDGVVITQVATGGYDDLGCTYPRFKVNIPSQRLTPSGPHQLSLRIRGETVSLTIAERFENRRMTLTGGKLLGGMDAIVVVEPKPTLIGEDSLEFDYYSSTLNDLWCFAKNGVHGFDSSLTRVPPGAWDDQGFSFRVPTNMPSGLGTLRINDTFTASVMPCPFAECRVSIGHLVKIDNVEVMQP